MPGKLIAFIAILLIIVTFIGFNYDNRSDITIWPGKAIFTDVPIFVSFFVMYLIGVVSVIPFIIGWKVKSSRKIPSAETEEVEPKKTGKNKVSRVLGSKKSASIANTTEKVSGEIPDEGQSNS